MSTIGRVACAAALATMCAGIGTAHATFIEQPSATPELKYYLVKSSHSNNFSGDIGGQATGKIVNGVANVNVDAANGFATVKPSHGAGALTTITLTPVDTLAWGDFVLRGQSYGTGDIGIKITDAGGTAYNFTESVTHDMDFGPFVFASTDSESIASIVLTDTTSFHRKEGFKELKQLEFSVCTPKVNGGCNGGGGGLPVPEPTSYLILLPGLLGLGLVRRFIS